MMRIVQTIDPDAFITLDPVNQAIGATRGRGRGQRDTEVRWRLEMSTWQMTMEISRCDDGSFWTTWKYGIANCPSEGHRSNRRRTRATACRGCRVPLEAPATSRNAIIARTERSPHGQRPAQEDLRRTSVEDAEGNLVNPFPARRPARDGAAPCTTLSRPSASPARLGSRHGLTASPRNSRAGPS
jgi:hypothetical protein